MDIKAAIWIACAGLAVASVCLMAGLVLRRYVMDRRALRISQRRQVLTTHLIRAMDPQSDMPFPVVTDPQEQRLLAGLGRDMYEVVRGEDKDRLLAILDTCGVVHMALSDLVHGASSDRRQAAIAILAPFDRAEIRHTLMTVLEGDRLQQVRLAAAFALVEWGGMPPLDRLIRALDIPDGKGSRRLFSLFAMIAAKNPLELVQVARSDPSPGVLILALSALAQAGEFAALPVVLEAVHHPDMDVRVEAYRSLAHLGHPCAQSVLADGLSDPAWQVRAQAAQCAGRVGLDEFAQTLVGLLGDGEWWVRYRAATALVDLGDTGRRLLADLAALALAANQPSEQARMAQFVLAECGDGP